MEWRFSNSSHEHHLQGHRILYFKVFVVLESPTLKSTQSWGDHFQTCFFTPFQQYVICHERIRKTLSFHHALSHVLPRWPYSNSTHLDFFKEFSYMTRLTIYSFEFWPDTIDDLEFFCWSFITSQRNAIFHNEFYNFQKVFIAYYNHVNNLPAACLRVWKIF